MHAGNVGFIAKRGLPPHKTGEFRLLKRGQDGGKPCRRLGMAVTGIMTETVGMRHKQCRHEKNLYSVQRQ